jgi:hypothetical protein
MEMRGDCMMVTVARPLGCGFGGKEGFILLLFCTTKRIDIGIDMSRVWVVKRAVVTLQHDSPEIRRDVEPRSDNDEPCCTILYRTILYVMRRNDALVGVWRRRFRRQTWSFRLDRVAQTIWIVSCTLLSYITALFPYINSNHGRHQRPKV